MSAPNQSGSLYTRLVSSVVFPLQERLKHHDSVAIRDRLEASQWWPRERLDAAQAERLRDFLVEIGTSVPYYRNLYARIGFDPTAVRGATDLRVLPLLDKATIRQHTDEMKHRQANGLARFNTGGSSGEPLVFFLGRGRVSHDVGAKWRATRWWGVDIGDPEIVVWGSPIELGAQDHMRQIRDAVFRTRLLPAFEMSEAKLDGFLAEIRRGRPRMIFGYPSAISLIAQHARRRGVRLDDLGVRVVFVTSERLYDDQRRAIGEAFGCPVANGYGGRDAGFIAHQCPAGGMHLSHEDIVVELVDTHGLPVPAGQPGEIVVTHLATGDFPFVRYRTGDIAVLDDASCSCGRGLPMLREIQGRSTDFVVAADGTVMHGLALIYVLRDLPGVKAFKVVQHDLLRTSVQIVPGPGWGPEIEATIVRGFKQRLGSDVRIEIDLVTVLASERSGKFRYIVSQVSQAERE